MSCFIAAHSVKIAIPENKACFSWLKLFIQFKTREEASKIKTALIRNSIYYSKVAYMKNSQVLHLMHLDKNQGVVHVWGETLAKSVLNWAKII